MKPAEYNVSISARELQTCFDKINALGLRSVEEILHHPEIGKAFYETLYAFLCEDCFSTFSNREKLDSLTKKQGSFDSGASREKYMTLKHDAFMKLLSKITRGNNKGRIRMDIILQDKPCAAWIPTIQTFVNNNIIKDAFKKLIPDSLDKSVYDEEGNSIPSADLLDVKKNPELFLYNTPETAVQSDMVVNDLCALIVQTLGDRPEELVAYSYALTNHGALKSNSLVAKMRKAASARQILADSLAQLEENFFFQFENEMFDVSLAYLDRIEKILSYDDKRAAAELSKACSRAGKKIRGNEAICKLR